jgi:hypothetical protein
LELTAVQLALQALFSKVSNTHILIKSDNQTTVVGINKQGSTHSQNCNSATRSIWLWAMSRDIWLSATHCPGVNNVEADRASRLFNDSTEWQLNPKLFTQICHSFGKPSVDLFASRLNFQLKPYCSWQPDPEAQEIDSFTIDWSTFNLVYIFPPFSLIARVLQKICQDQADAILVIPHWTTQPWFPRLCSLLTAPPLILKTKKDTLTLPHDPDRSHPLLGQLTLWVCRLSGKSMKLKVSPQKW